MTDLFPGVGAGSLLHAQLLADDRSTRIGAIYRLDYSEAIVLTHDKWKFDAGGIPQYSFLLATAQDINTPQVDDDEVLLLRVEGTAPLSMENDLHAVREESLRSALSSSNDPSPSAVLDVELDPFTRNRVSFTGLRCRVLGTFYEDDVDGTKVLEFGADVDNFYATATYRVLKPIGDGLSTIASYLKPTGREQERVRIGAVRYSATRRRAKTSNQADAAVEVNIYDFIGNKTALLGMTRMGKSNTAKTIIARTFVISERQRNEWKVGQEGNERKGPIGQLIFDPQGEYANANTQDGTEIAAIGASHVSIYKFGADGSQAHVKPLNINFYSENQIDAVQGLISEELSGDGSGYVKDFALTSYSDVPGDRSASTHAQRARLVLYGALMRAGFNVPRNFRTRINMATSFQAKIVSELGRNPFTQAGSTANYVTVGAGDLEAVVDTIISLREGSDQDALDFTKDVRWKSVEPIFTTQSQGRSVRGWRNLNPLRPFHSPLTQNDPAIEIYDELVDGRIVIVDLHVGAEAVTKALSEDITRRLLSRQTAAFTSGVEPPHIQVMLEEAHNLFASDRYKDELDVWVKLAKEASKLNLGMTYATQEVSGVAHQVKANTANWVVAHLNNTTEVGELAKFYDFRSYKDAIIASEDRGYVRLKTLSSPFIVPVQIDRYDVALVNEARAAAGDPPLSASQGS